MRTTRTLIVGGLSLTALAVILYSSAETVTAQIRAAYMKNVDEPGRLPYQHSIDPGSSPDCNNAICAFHFPTVPAGKRLVVEDISVQLNSTTEGAEFVAVAYASSASNPGVLHVGKLRADNFFAVLHAPSRMYFGPGIEPLVVVGSLGTPSFSAGQATIIGYLIDAVN